MQYPHTSCPPRDRKPCSGRKIGAGSDRGDTLILGAVIAGGRASRFGSDKATALFKGRPLIDNATAALSAHVDAVIIVGREWDGTTIADLPRAGLGPLGGIAAALDHALASGYASVLTIGCDMPHVPLGLLETLRESAPSYCPDAPILGHWPASLTASLIERLDTDGDRSVRRWAHQIGARTVPAPSPLANINTPGDLAAL